MSQPVKPKNTVVGPPQVASPGTVDSQNDNTSAPPILDDDGINIAPLFAPPEAPGELGRLGHFRILKKLGAGGMGMVLLAEDINLLRTVALKIMLPKYARSAQAKERFLREARTAAKIQHDHVVTIHHVGQDRNIPFIAMEFLQGASLDDYLKEKKRVSLAQAMRIGRETAEGLQAAHALGLVHRDIKPANIWLEGPKARVKILDFGLARDAADEAKLTHSGAIVGTPAYMSPEQALGLEVDQRTDLFSLGIVLFELVTGRLPFTGTSTMSLMRALTYDPHQSIAALNPHAPAGLVKLIDRLLEKKVVDRFESAAAVTDAIAELEKPAVRPDGKPVVEVVYLPAPTSVVDDPFANIDATPSEMSDPPVRDRPVSRDAKSSERSARRTKTQGDAASGRRWMIPAACGVALIALIVTVFALRNKPQPTDPAATNIASTTKPEPPPGREWKGRMPTVEIYPQDQDDEAKEISKVDPRPAPVTKGIETSYDLGNGVKLEMVAINAKGKSFLMGSPQDEPDRSSSNKVIGDNPEEQHEVTFGHNFAMGKYEVTQEQYAAIMGTNPAKFVGAKQPVESLSWDDAQEFISKLNGKFKDHKVKFRLPSEAEWEYACRAGSTTAYSTGTTLTKNDACFDRTVREGTLPVGSYRPNAFGLYDMQGNVYEFCEDYVGSYKTASKDGTAKLIQQSNNTRIVRGGSWLSPSRGCRSADRFNISPTYLNVMYGFRLVASQDDAPEPPKVIAPPPITKGDETTYDLGNGVKLEMIAINAKGKSFLMGSPKDEPDRPTGIDSSPFGSNPEEQHEVTFGHNFAMGKYEVTQEQYEAIMGTNPAKFTGAKRPVEMVSWNDTQEFIKKLNEKFKDRNVKFRLPSEAEWEYACRAGTTTAYNTGKTLTMVDACFDDKSKAGTKPAGTFKPNAFGLYDMHGNAYEYCEDCAGPYSKARKNGTAQLIVNSSVIRVARGGCYLHNARICRSASRFSITASSRYNDVGFRLVASQDEPAEVPKLALPPPAPVTNGNETTYDLGNGVKLEMIAINANGKSFLMGSPKDETDRSTGSVSSSFGSNPEEQHEVTFAHNFAMGKYEVTQEQYEAIMGTNPARYKDPKKPVESVSWNDAQEFITKLNAKFKDHNVKFRLPSEAEWEYACRAGTTTAYNTGNTLTRADASLGGSSNVRTKPVGSFKPNAFGVYDMHGNVIEWCEDYAGPYSKAPKDGTPLANKQSSYDRVIRGGEWYINTKFFRSAYRYSRSPTHLEDFYGFRLVADVAPPIFTKGDEATYDLGNGIKLEMIAINAKGKSFQMGSPKNEPERMSSRMVLGDNPEEQHEVTFGHNFAMGNYEVTQEQYEAIMGTNPAKFTGAKRPVEMVSWNDTQEFIKKLNEKFKDRNVKFRLPSEAEWEYACRAGTTTAYNTGKTLTRADAAFDDRSNGGTKAVGSFKPNAFGLYDMHGNVCEWCEDFAGPYSKAAKDGKAPSIKQSNESCVVRGGNWNFYARYCRSAYREDVLPTFRSYGIGFRLAASQD